MKKNILLFAMAASLQPEGNATTDQYFMNDQQAIDAVDALYERFHQEVLYGRDLFDEQIGANDVVWGRTCAFSTLATFEYTGDEDPLADTFDALYVVMARSNWVIEQLLNKQKSTALSEVETRSLGEAYFTRGWAHFLIAYRYGLDEQGVPFVRYEDFPNGYDNSIPPQRESVMENYRLIIEDMDKAMEYLPRFEEYDASNQGRAHDAAAVAFKVKVYAYWATWDETKWQDVINLVNDLETTYGRDLADTFAQLYSSDFADYWNKEYLWSIPSTGGAEGGGSKFPGVILQYQGWGKYNGWGQLKPTYDIYEEMLKDGEGNDRIVRSILEYNQEFQYFGETMRFYDPSEIESGFMINKYMEPFGFADPLENGYVNTNGDFGTARVNFPVIRFAEMLLFRAEAYLMTNQADLATNDLNRIRNRSNLNPLDHTATMTDLYHERRCELAFEFTDHLFDLKRWHRSSNAEIKELAADELNASHRVRNYVNRSDPESSYTIGVYGDYMNKRPYDDHYMVFPYPSNQLVNSNGLLNQNPGYNL